MPLTQIFFLYVPLALMLIISVGMPFWKVQLVKKAGNKVMSLVRKRSIINWAAAILCYLLVILVVAFDFGRFNFVFPYCAVLGLYITTRENTLKPINGLYEKVLISGTDVLYLDDIIKIEENNQNQPDYIMTVITKKGSKRNITFDNANELKEVRTLIKK